MDERWKCSQVEGGKLKAGRPTDGQWADREVGRWAVGSSSTHPRPYLPTCPAAHLLAPKATRRDRLCRVGFSSDS